MHRFALLVIFVTLLSGSVAQAASYEKTDGAIVDPILDTSGSTHPYSGDNLEPDANLSLWPGADGLLNAALVLVTDNAQAGRVNGKRLTVGVPYLSKPTPHAPGVASAGEPGGHGTLEALPGWPGKLTNY